jgi:hypothetical protein
MVKEISLRTEDMENISDNNYEIQKMESFQYSGSNVLANRRLQKKLQKEKLCRKLYQSVWDMLWKLEMPKTRKI